MARIVGTKAHFKQITLNFCNKHFLSKSEEVNIIIEFSTFQLVLAQNLSLNRQSTFLRPNLPKQDVSGFETEKLNIKFCTS